MKSFALRALFVFGVSLSAHGGPRVIGNGGDTYALQFVTFAQNILLYLQNSNIKGLDTEALSQVIEKTHVESTTKELKLNGLEKDAINYPSENRIIFNRTRWTAMVMDERLALVLHEYLGLLGVEDASYKYSRLLLKDMTTIERIRRGSDSSWYLCQDDYLIINTFEHRDGFDTRATNITLIFGGWVLEGELVDVKAGSVVLKSAPGDGSFVGDVKIWFEGHGEDRQRITLIGILKVFDNLIQVNKTLKCQEKYRE